jgi:hypothetical protein
MLRALDDSFKSQKVHVLSNRLSAEVGRKVKGERKEDVHLMQ